MSSVLVCTHDDRPEAQAGIKLLLLSLGEHCPGLDVLVSCPNPDQEFIAWLSEQANVLLHIEPDFAGKGWNIKPQLLLHCLDTGYEQVIWIDSDVIVARDFRELMFTTNDETFIVAADYYWACYVFPGGTVRAELWGLRPGRSLSWTANTGIVRVTPAHRPLLEAWKKLLEYPAYVQAHRRTWYTRPIHMVGDQDVLTALLSSERFRNVPIQFLRRGKDVIYNFGPSGYTPCERLANLRGPAPPFVHCTGPKPWDAPQHVCFLKSPAAYYKRVGLELADYSRVARRYRQQLDSDVIAFDRLTLVGKVFCLLAGNSAPMQGFLLALFHGTVRHLRKAMGFNYWPKIEANLCEGERPNGDDILEQSGSRAK